MSNPDGFFFTFVFSESSLTRLLMLRTFIIFCFCFIPFLPVQAQRYAETLNYLQQAIDLCQEEIDGLKNDEVADQLEADYREHICRHAQITAMQRNIRQYMQKNDRALSQLELAKDQALQDQYEDSYSYILKSITGLNEAEKALNRASLSMGYILQSNQTPEEQVNEMRKGLNQLNLTSGFIRNAMEEIRDAARRLE